MNSLHSLQSRSSAHILAVSRDASSLACVRRVVGGLPLETAESRWAALERVQSGTELDLVLLDLAEGDDDGLYILRWLRRVRPELAVIVLSHSRNPEERVEALRMGAQEYLCHPLNERDLRMALERQLAPDEFDSEFELAADDVERVSHDLLFVSATPAMHKLRAQAELLAQVQTPVLIVGEKGSGKEITARLIHKLSVRSGFRFVKVRCSDFPGDLLEGELFGTGRGLTNGSNGAGNVGQRSKPGKLDLCDQGVLFLDEIETMPLAVQAKLLQAIQEKSYVRGGVFGERVELRSRIIAGTGAHVEQAVARKQLREDLYYRLSAFSVYVPPLRLRKDEIPLLMGHFMKQMSGHYGLPARPLSARIMAACQTYSWPGNLNELRDFTKRYLVVGDEELAIGELGQNSEEEMAQVRRGDRESLAKMGVSNGRSGESDAGSGLKSLLRNLKDETEKTAIIHALELTHWNRKAAARTLKVSYRTLLYKIQQYHLSPPSGHVSVIMPGNGIKLGGQRDTDRE